MLSESQACLLMKYFVVALVLLAMGMCQSSHAQIEVCEGPLKDKRIEALAYIGKAKKYGVGTKPYLKAFQSIEADVGKGIPESQIKDRLDRLTRSVYQQMLRARDIKQKALSGGGAVTNAELRKYKGKRVPVSILERLMFSYVNNERQAKGLKRLSRNYRLDSLAREHSKDMMKRNYFSHKNPEGKNAFQRAKDRGLNVSIYENIAKVATGQGSPVSKAKTAHKGLMQSTSHRENILKPEFVSIGIGISYGRGGDIAVTQVFSKQTP